MAMTSRYIHDITFSGFLPDQVSWENRLLEMGLEREAFCIVKSDDTAPKVEFWEPDRIQALRFLARLESLPS